jgi:putative addiction module component (TIGR02574 family)
MNSQIAELLKQALALPAEERATLAGSLLESLHEYPAEAGTEEAWADEIKRRVEQIESGEVQMLSQEEVRRRLAARLAAAGA